MPSTSQPKLYNPLHPERTLLYQMVAEHYETLLDLASAGQFDGQGDYRTPKSYVRKAFGKYLECGIFAHGFARARLVKELSSFQRNGLSWGVRVRPMGLHWRKKEKAKEKEKGNNQPHHL